MFLVLLHPGGDPVTWELRRHYDEAERLEGLPPLNWTTGGDFAVAVAGDESGLYNGPALACTSRLVVVGSARLDNRNEVVGWVHASERLALATDLQVVAEALEVRGAACVPDILGDFAFIAWNASARELLAARDAFGGRALYYTVGSDLVALSSRAAVLASGDSYNLDFIADYLVAGINPSEPTIFGGVSSIPAGTMLTFRNRSAAVSRYWSAQEFEIDPRLGGEEQYLAFRDLLIESVRLRSTRGNQTWAMLSGGLDSSSIVSIAQQLGERETGSGSLGGTVTLVDTLGDGDEREYVRAVLDRYKVRNETLVDFEPLQSDGVAPPQTDSPAPQYPFYARDRSIAGLVKGAGGQVLLSGYGSDHYLAGNLYFLADRVWSGESLGALRELAHWAAVGRVSFWRLSMDHLAFPLAPTRIQQWMLSPDQRPPRWIRSEFARCFDLQSRLPALRALRSTQRGAYASVVAAGISEFGMSADRNYLSQLIEVRYPFLYRPLVELALRLPPEERTRPFARKWVLRKAMRGILPERIRQRSSKGGIGGRIDKWLLHAQGAVDALLHQSILAQLGCVEPSRLRAAIYGPNATPATRASVMRFVSLELWLRVRSGRWNAPGMQVGRIVRGKIAHTTPTGGQIVHATRMGG
jgi:asparagine synthase (glutamine-hydrolysing)